MKTLEINQMESLQGGWGKSDWCLVGVILGVGAAVASGGTAAPLVIASLAATGLSC